MTGAITEHRGPGRVAYFRTVVKAESGGTATLELWDALQNEDHAPISARVLLEPGSNELLLRVVGGQYATGGFYAAVER